MMKPCLLLSLLFFSYSVNAQAPDIEWQNTIGGGSDDKLYSLKQTKDKGYILGGSSGSNIFGDKTETNYGTQDYWVLKLDSTGSIVWQKTIGGSLYDYLFSIETNDGGYICGGSSESGISGNKTESNFGLFDYWVVKLDSIGNIEWQKVYGGENDDYLYEIIQTPEGGYILGGWSSSGISGNKTEGTIGYEDYWIIKLDSAGEIEWQNTIGGDETDILYSFDKTIDGGYILGGWSRSGISGDKTEEDILRPDGLLTADYWIVKLDITGNIEWQNTIGGEDDDYLYNINQTKDEGYILSGKSRSNISADKNEENIGLQDFWVIKTDSIGNVLWQNTIGGENDEGSNGVFIQQTFDGGYVVSGSSDSNISGDKTESSEGYSDYWVIKLNSIGLINWQSSIGGSISDINTNVNQVIDGGYILGGYSGSDISGDKTENGIGNGDYWVVKLYPDDTCTPLTYYADYDADGYGNNTFPILSCDTPSAYVLNNLDCNDLNSLINPATAEICNSIDDNCNSSIDEDIPYYTYYADNDADGYGDVLSSITNCIDTIPAGYVTDNTDCDDANNTIYEPVIYYADADADLYGNISESQTVCSTIPPSGYVTNYLDCNDEDIFINPASNEVCNNTDDNCNTDIDEGLPVQVLYADEDGDNFGNAESDSVTCLFEIPGYVNDSTDCNDNNPDIYPGAVEIFNGTDDNCDGSIDEGLNITELADEGLFTIYPNPADGSFIVRNNTLNNVNDMHLYILNALGESIYHTLLWEKETNKIILPENLYGNFFITIYKKEILIYSQLITILK